MRSLATYPPNKTHCPCSMQFSAIIPARYASTRFPGKPLALLGGRPIIEHVYRRAAEVFTQVCVATDDERIVQAVESFGGRAVMTSQSHRSGTDRCYEAYQKLEEAADVVVNIQGDEPFIASEQLNTIRRCFDTPATDIATLVMPFSATTPMAEIENPNSPKVVCDDAGFALYFSRSVIPYLRGIDREAWPAHHTFLKHIGLYAYRTDTLRRITTLPPSPLEVAESLEQLRWLQAGLRIKVGITHTETIGIDTPEDLARASAFLASRQ